MIVLFKTMCRTKKRDVCDSTNPYRDHDYPHSSASSTVVPGSEKSQVQDWPDLRLPLKFRRKMDKLTLSKPKSTSSIQETSRCSATSSATASEAFAGSPSAFRKDSLEAIVPQQNPSVARMAPSFSDTSKINATALHEPCAHDSTPSIPRLPLKLEGITALSIPSMPTSATGSNASCGTEGSAPLSPSSFASSIPSSSSSATSTEHSSYSATHNLDHNANNDNSAQRRYTDRRRIPTETRANPTSLRPLGPAHLEHDYAVARKALSAAVAVAAHELFGFSVPVRNDDAEAKRPRKESIPLLRKHPLVRRAAQAVDEADQILEEALARGETIHNTPVPDEWRWGSEYLRPHDWAYLEPEFVTEKKVRRIKARNESSEASEPRTRSKKRKQTQGNITGEENHNEFDQLIEISETKVVPTNVPSGTSHDGAPSTTNESMQESTASPFPELEKIGSDAGPSSGKRKRGRPRKNVPGPCDTEIETSVVTVAQPASGNGASSPSEVEKTIAVTPAKRKRGRPRKNALITEPPSDGPTRRGAVAVPAPPEPERRSKRRRTSSSVAKFS